MSLSRFFLPAIAGLIGLVGASTADALSFGTAWQIPAKGGYSAPNLVTDASGRTVAIVASEKGVGVVAFAPDGKRIWEHAMIPPLTAPPAVADMDGDGAEDVIAADCAGNVAVLRSGDGSALWTAQLHGGSAASSPSAVDVDGDGRREILLGDRSGALSCLDHTGKLRWRFMGDGEQTGPLLVADVYATPGKEVFVPSHDRCIYALSARGEWLWDLHFPADLFPNSQLILADVDRNQEPELYAGGGLHHFYRINLANPAITFEHNVYMHVNSAIVASDLDRDGKDEVIFGSKAGAVNLYGHEGIRWTRAIPQTSFQSSPVLLKTAAEGGLVAIFFGYEGSAVAYDAMGNLVAEATGLGCKPEMSGLLAGDLDNDGQAEIIAASGSAAEGAPALFCFELGIPFLEDAGNRLIFGQDRAHSGTPPGFSAYPLLPAPAPVKQGPSSAGMEATAQATLQGGLNTWRYDVENPEEKRLALHLAVESPDGAVWRFVRHSRDAKRRSAFSFPVDMPGTYQVARQLMDADSRELILSEQEQLSYAGFDADVAHVESVCTEIEAGAAEWRKSNPVCAKGIESATETLRARLMLARTAEANERSSNMATLIETAARLATFAKAGPLLAPEGTFAAWEFCAWAYFDPQVSLPSPECKTESMALSLGREEYGSLALNISNLSPQSLEIRALFEGWTRSGGDGKPVPGGAVTFRRAVVVPTQNREMVADALPQLDQAGAMSVASLETQQLWLTVESRGLEPGEYETVLRLKSVEVQPTERRIPIRLTVLDLAPPRPRPLRLCNWVMHTGELSSGDDAALRDLTSHGETVFLAPAPLAQCDAAGNLIAEPDFAAHDEAVKRLAPHGFVMFLSPQGGLGGQPFLSEAWKKAFVSYLRTWKKHLDGLGVGNAQWALYPYDEPSAPYGETMRNLVEVAKLAREADPAILIYTDPTSGFTMECAAMLDGLIDIWQPSDELVERLGPELLPWIKERGKQLWFYEAAGNSKTLSCLGKYLWRFWYAFEEDFTGVGWWVYAIHGPDRWDGPNPVNDYWATVYNGIGGPVSSKRWEITREGVQDYERLFALREELRAAKARGIPEAELAPMQNVLDETPGNIEAMLLRTGRRLPLNPDSVPQYEEVARAVEQARTQIKEARLRLKTLMQ